MEIFVALAIISGSVVIASSINDLAEAVKTRNR